MMKPRSINIFLLDGDPNGIRVAQISMSTIQAIAFRRNQLSKVRKTFPELGRPGVYILLGQDEENPDLWVAYVGESESVGDRLGFHMTNDKSEGSKGFWADTIVLVSKDENLTKSHARYAEARLLAEAGRNPRWNLKNSQRASEVGKLPLPERAAMEEFIDQTITLVGALGCDLFRGMRGSLPEERSPPEAQEPIAAGIVFFLRGQGFAAEMLVNELGEFVIKKGSRARHQENPSIPSSISNFRKTLAAKGILREESGALVFMSDYTFSSPSTAASVIYGGSINGRTSWRLTDGRTYATWEENQATDAGAVESRSEMGSDLSAQGPPGDQPRI